MNSSTLIAPAGALALVGALAGAQGCQSSSPRSEAQVPGLNAGLDEVAMDGPAFPRAGGTVAGAPERSTEELLALMAEAQRNASVSVDDTPARPATTGAPAGVIEDVGPGAQANPGPALEAPEATDAGGPEVERLPEGDEAQTERPEAAPELTPSQRAERASTELADLLRDRLVSSDAPAAEVIRLGALQIVHPGAPEAGGIDATMTPREKEIVAAWGRFASAVRDTLDSASDPATIADGARELADELDAWRPLEIATVRLCTSVGGYGVYDELATFGGDHRFLAGRAIGFVVYAEIERFTHTSASRDGTWGHEVALTMDMRLYHLGLDGDALVWRKPDQLITDFSAQRRRDFFVVQQVKLPATLGVGSYRLKLTITDRASGGEAEALVPFEIVANTAALRE